jgi:hypothetical protein
MHMKALYEMVSAKIAKPNAGSFARMRKTRNGHCGGVDPLRNGRRNCWQCWSKSQTGGDSGRRKDGERELENGDRELSGSGTLAVSRSGRAPLRREWEEPLESDRHGGTSPWAGGRHKERPSRRKGGDVP